MAPRLLVMASPGKTMSTPPSPCSAAIAILPSMRQRRTSTRQTETPPNLPLLIIQLSKRGIIIPSESGLPCGQQYNLGVSKLATPLNHLLTDCKKPRRCSISICWKTYHRITAAAPTYQALLWDIPKVLEVCLKNALKPMLWGADKKRAKFWIFQNIEEEKNYILW